MTRMNPSARSAPPTVRHGGLLSLWTAVLIAAVLCLGAGPDLARAEAPGITLEKLQQQIRELQRKNEQQQRMIQQMQQRLDRLAAQKGAEAAGAQAALDQALQNLDTGPRPERGPSSIYARRAGSAEIRLIDISFGVNMAIGASTQKNEALEALQGGHHDPKRTGFTLQDAELGLAGAVDPYVNGEAYISFNIDGSGETVVELEEAFMTTQSLPHGLQVEMGHFLTEFGRINPSHPHSWQWMDQPIVNTRMFGGDGMRAPGVRAGWLAPTSWFSQVHFGVQYPKGETMVSFLSNSEIFAVEHDHGEEEEAESHGHSHSARAIGNGRFEFVDQEVRSLDHLVYLARWENSMDLTDEVTTLFGLSGLHGPNAAAGDTWLFGADLVAKWKPARNYRGWPFVLFETEIMGRSYHAGPGAIAEHEHEEEEEEEEHEEHGQLGATIHDWGLTAQLLYGFRPKWAAGLRYEYAGGWGESHGGRAADPYRNDRYRVSPLLSWYPSEFLRFRLQYNYDHADHLEEGGDAHTIWFGAEFLWGTHPAHKF